MQISVLENVQKKSSVDLSTNSDVLNGLAWLSLCFASSLGKGVTPALVLVPLPF